MYMNVHKTGFSAVFHISVMIFKLAHLIHLDLDHQNVFRQFHTLFYQNQINSFIRYPSIRYPSIRYPSIRYPSFLPCLYYPCCCYYKLTNSSQQMGNSYTNMLGRSCILAENLYQRTYDDILVITRRLRLQHK